MSHCAFKNKKKKFSSALSLEQYKGNEVKTRSLTWALKGAEWSDSFLATLTPEEDSQHPPDRIGMPHRSEKGGKNHIILSNYY
jgi:hypothetical protein